MVCENESANSTLSLGKAVTCWLIVRVCTLVWVLFMQSNSVRLSKLNAIIIKSSDPVFPSK